MGAQYEVTFPDTGEDVSYLPRWAQQETTPPATLKLLGACLLLPLVAGGVGVHLTVAEAGHPEPSNVHDRVASYEQDVQHASVEYSRTLLSWSLHYAGALLAAAGAMHWGMQLAEF